MSQIVECGHNIKSFDLERLQSLTLSGERITKEIFDALFLNQSPYYYSTQSTVYPCDFNSVPQLGSQGTIACHKRHDDSFDSKNHEIFFGAFETAANYSKIASTNLSNDSQYIENRFYQAPSQAQNYF